jgi:Ulp1 family protease
VIDSFNLHAQQYFYFIERIEFLLKHVFGPKDWGFCCYDDLPRQQNGEDCGVALCINAAQLAKC